MQILKMAAVNTHPSLTIVMGSASMTTTEMGLCDEFEIFGCTDAEACNYSEGATDDDGSCSYDCQGCTSAACNYDPTATIDDGSCDFHLMHCFWDVQMKGMQL